MLDEYWSYTLTENFSIIGNEPVPHSTVGVQSMIPQNEDVSLIS